MSEAALSAEPHYVRRAAVFRLYPTVAQELRFAQWAGAVRFVYNLALEQRQTFWRPGRHFNFVSQGREVTSLRTCEDWLADVPRDSLGAALRDLDAAYRNWWAGRAAPPRPRRKGVNDSFRFSAPATLDVRRTGESTGQVKLPKVGWVRLRGWRTLPGDLRNMTISRRAGKWFAAVQCRREIPAPEPSTLPAVGIDLGITVFAALSDGTAIAPLNSGKRALKALRRARRDMARKVRGSVNRRKAVRRVAKMHKRVSDARKDFLHKQSSVIAKNHGVVVVEALRVQAMSASARGTVEAPGRGVRQKAGLNRSILDQGWGAFRTMLAYKLAERGGQLIEVPAAYTSQTCSACGCVDPASRGSQARFLCVACGHSANADTNAAINVLRRADSALKPVEVHRSRRPDEAGTASVDVKCLRNGNLPSPPTSQETT